MSEQVMNVVEDETPIRVENMSDVQVGYVLASSGITRRFMPHVYMSIPAKELRELSYQKGGLYLLQNYLRVHNRELAKEFNIPDDVYEHEYSWTPKDIDNCLNDPDINVLLDALDFAPQGIIDSLKDRAIELEIPDTRKVKAIGEKTGVDIQQVIRNKHAYDDDKSEEAQPPKRRRTATTTRRRRAE